MTSKQEIENELKKGLEQFKDKINDLENKFMEERSQTDPVDQKISTEKINNLKTTIQALEKKLNELERADQQDTVNSVKKGIKAIMGNMDEEFRSSLSYFH